MRIELPLEVLGLLAPLLSWVEANEEVRLPGRRHRYPVRDAGRQRAWLRRELPTYSRDTLEEILERARESAGRPRTRGGLPWSAAPRDDRLEGVSPERDFDLMRVFARLRERYFDWDGYKLRIRIARLGEIHELAARFPVAHLIRHAHARAVAGGHLSQERARRLPERLSALHTASRSLRAVVERGLSEGHLHLWGVPSADDVWADHLFSRPATGAVGRFTSPERQLLRLGRFALGAVALGVLMAIHRHQLCEGPQRDVEPDPGTDRPRAEPGGSTPSPTSTRGEGVLPFSLLRGFDELYWTIHPAAQKHRTIRLRQDFHSKARDFFHLCRRRCHLAPAPGAEVHSCQQILYRLDPALVPLLGPGRRLALRHGEQRTGIQERSRWLECLHLEVQLQLLTLRELGRRPEIRGLGSPNPQLELLQSLRAFLHQAYFRYLVCHSHHLQLATQQGQTTGLREFQQFYGARQREFLGPEIAQQAAMVLDRLLDTSSLELLEARLSPPSRGLDDLKPWIQHYADRPEIWPHIRHLEVRRFLRHLEDGRDLQQLEDGRSRLGREKLPRFGIVLHFKKESHRTATFRQPGFPEPRHGRSRRRVRRQAFHLFRLLRKSHEVVPFIVGIDAASEELTTPPEVFAPAFRFLLDYPIEVVSSGSVDRRLRCGQQVLALLEKRRLGLTYHVGEDFRHLLCGLRAIHEAIEFLHLRPGDRLGHALALGLDPEGWAAQAGNQAVVPQQEWLDDLVWVHHFLGASHPAVGELELEDEIQHLGEEIYFAGDPLPIAEGGVHPAPRSADRREDFYAIPLTLHDAWRLRQLDPHLVSCTALKERRDPLPRGLPLRPEARRWLDVQRQVLARTRAPVVSRAACEYLRRYWFDGGCRRRGRKTLVVDMERRLDLWLRLCRDAQEKLKQTVQQRQLVVEVNPSSNRRIGPISSLAEHPILIADPEGYLTRQVVTTINTDDPGVFNTSLPHEYYLLGEVLLRRGRSEGEVMEWLDWLRRNGREYSFARYLPELDDPNLQELLLWIRRHGGPLSEWLRGQRASWQRRYRLAFRGPNGCAVPAGMPLAFHKLDRTANRG